MGGIGSGRSGGRPTVESAITLELAWLKQIGALKPGKMVRFTSGWTWGNTGRRIAAISLVVEAHETEAEITVASLTRFDTWDRPQEIGVGQRIRLVAVPAPLGGMRWWFVCPLSNRHVMKLHCPQGASRFGSRAAHRLGYACQRETPRDRAFRRARKARRCLGGSDNLTLPIPGRPKWMRQLTYWRLLARSNAAQEDVIGHSVALVEKMQRRLGIGAERRAR